MPKVRDYKDIKVVFDSSDTNLTIKHQTGDAIIPCKGGASIVPLPCGGGKSTATCDLVAKRCDKGIVIFVATRADANDMKKRLESLSLLALKDEIVILHQEDSYYSSYIAHPEQVTKKKVLIVPSVHLYLDYLPALFAYDSGKVVDISKYTGNLGALLKSTEVRKFCIIDEQPSFIQPFNTFERLKILAYMGNLGASSKGSIPVGAGLYYHCLGIQEMKAVNSTFLRKTSDHLYSTRSALNTYREEEVLVYINQNYSVIWNAKGKYYPIYHFIKDWVVKGMQMNVIILDATADVLSDYKKTPFRLIQNSGKMYSAPITFQEFPMSLERWLFEKDVDDNTIRDRIQDIVDELADQIQQASPLLIVTWKYMVARDSDPDKEDKHLNIMTVLEEELNKKGLAGKYSIIYRGSGQDKATNAFSNYTGISFVGEWRTGKSGLSLINKNYGIHSTERRIRTAGMIQAICRLRIRQHNGDPIHVFYSDDIDSQLMKDVFDYFRENSDAGVSISGMPVLTPATKRTPTLLKRVRVLCGYDPKLLDAIKYCRTYTLTIRLKDILVLIPMKEKKARSYDPLRDTLKKEYNIILKVVR